MAQQAKQAQQLAQQSTDPIAIGAGAFPPPPPPDGPNGPLADLFAKLKQATLLQKISKFTKDHPYQSAGYLGLGMGNLGGLTDNDKIGGQLTGAALGAIAGNAIPGLAQYGGMPMAALAGGQLGALFDKLRAKKEQEQQGYYRGR